MKNMPVTILVGASLFSAAFSILSFGVFHNYSLIANVDCDPATESCFIGDGENTPETYKIVEIRATEVPSCNGWEGECKPLSCDPSTVDCMELQCEEESEDCYSAL